MSALGRGLSSLIPKRNNSNAGDIIDSIDSGESIDIEQEVKITTNNVSSGDSEIKDKERVQTTKISVSDEEDEMAQPKKPLVTPLSFDPYQANDADYEKKEEVEESTENESLFGVAEDEQEVAENSSTEEPSEEFEPAKAQAVQSTETIAGKEEEVIKPGFGESNISMWDKHEDRVEHVPIGDIVINPLQPRRSFDPAELEELTRSIEQHGVLQPLVVRRVESGYELIAGERRLRSVKALKWERVPCVVRRDVKSDQSRLVFALIENIQRENLNPIEEAMAYKELSEEYGLSHEEIGQRVGRSRVGITNIIRILQLPAEIQRGLAENKITMGHARAILMIPDQEKQIRFYHHLLDEGLTVRKAEIRARRIQRNMGAGDPSRQRNRNRHPLALKYSPVLEERYGYDANVRYVQDKNLFEVVFKAHSESEIEELVARLSGASPLPKDVDQDVLDD